MKYYLIKEKPADYMDVSNGDLYINDLRFFNNEYIELTQDELLSILLIKSHPMSNSKTLDTFIKAKAKIRKVLQNE